MILPNAANQCSSCLAQDFDLKSILQRGPGGGDIIIHQCRQCRRFERNERLYEHLDIESPELLALCLKHIPALSASADPKLHLVDAMWIFTEPHSMRLKVRLTVRTEVQNVMIQQRVAVELIHKWKQCPDCNREYTNRVCLMNDMSLFECDASLTQSFPLCSQTWHAIVQLRQKRNDDSPRKGLVILEMALARNPDVRKHVLSIDTCKQGFDFYFVSLMHAQTFSSYLARIAPMRIKTTKKLVSTDVKNNTANMKYTVTCDMVPLCRDDLIMVHKSAKGILSGRLCLVTKVSSIVHLVDASPKRSPAMDEAVAEVAPETYYKAGGDKLYRVVSSSRRLIRYVVLDVELCEDEQYGSGGDRILYNGPSSSISKFALADVEVARESDFGRNNETFRCVTHLGNLLDAGDIALGYDLASAVLSGGAEWSMSQSFNGSFRMPDVVLVKKVQGVEKEKEEERARSNGSKKRERRRKRDEKRMHELEAAAERMGFLESEEFNQEQFNQELSNDPALAEELVAAERELSAINESMSELDVVASNESTEAS